MTSSEPHRKPEIDSGRSIDWGRTSDDYAEFRPGPPNSFYEMLRALRVGRPGQRILDLGTGTGALARRLAARGASVIGIDVAAAQIEAARRLAAQDRVSVDFRVAPAEQTGLPAASFDVITACQSWLYFKRPDVCQEVNRLLAPGGRLLTAHVCWLPLVDPIARRSEELVLQFNPAWAAAGFDGNIVPCPAWAAGDFRVTAMFYYDEPIPFSRDSWRGRIRACRGVGATLSRQEVEQFDAAHDRLLRQIADEEFTILHRIDCHVFEPHPKDDGAVDRESA